MGVTVVGITKESWVVGREMGIFQTMKNPPSPFGIGVKIISVFHEQQNLISNVRSCIYRTVIFRLDANEYTSF